MREEMNEREREREREITQERGRPHKAWSVN